MLSRSTPKKHETLPSRCPDFGAEKLSTAFISWNTKVSDQSQAFAASGYLARDNGPCVATGRILSVSGKPIAHVIKAWNATDAFFNFKTAFDLPGFETVFDSCRVLEPRYDLTGQDRVEVL
jgi:hypothetical protein